MAALRSRMRDRFCLYVAQGFNYTRAAKEAGFAVPKNMGARLMAVPEVRARVEELDKAAEGARIREVTRVVVPTREYVIKGLIDNVEAAKEAGDRGAVNKGLELIGKEIGMFVRRNMQIDSPLQRLPADKLVQLLQLIDGALIPDTDRQRPIEAPATVEQIESLTIEGEAARAEKSRNEDW